jgi:hypothetical protein
MKTFCIAALCSLLALAPQAQAEPIQVSFSAQVVSAEENSPFANLSGKVDGFAVYESSASAIPQADGSNAFRFDGAPNLFTIPDLALNVNSFGIGISSADPASPNFDELTIGTKVNALSYIVVLEVPLGQLGGIGLPSVGALNAPPSAASLYVIDSNLKLLLRANIISLQASAVPELSTNSYTTLGLLIGILVATRKSKFRTQISERVLTRV